MKKIILFPIVILLASTNLIYSQNEIQDNEIKAKPTDQITLQAAIGLHPAPLSDIAITGLLMWNVKKHITFGAYSSFSFNDVLVRNFNYIKTNYNFSINQKLGIGTSLYGKRKTHSILLAGGIKYDAFSQTLNNPEFEKVTVAVSALTPDYGILYNFRTHGEKLFFSFNFYLPLYPYPLKGMDINYMDSNLANVSVEMGIGFRLK